MHNQAPLGPVLAQGTAPASVLYGQPDLRWEAQSQKTVKYTSDGGERQWSAMYVSTPYRAFGNWRQGLGAAVPFGLPFVI